MDLKTKDVQEVYSVERVRKDFPILSKRVHDKPLVYLDNAATTQKPNVVIGALEQFYTSENSNVHRGVHALSEIATQKYEQAREFVRQYINAASLHEIIFTRGTTEGINLVAASFGRTFLHEGDEIVITTLEHHSNIVPWQLLCEEKSACLKVVPIDDKGDVLLDEYEKLLTEKTRLVAITHVSNALGTVNPVKEMIEIAHRMGIPVLIDGAQYMPHFRVDVQALDADFYVFSAHKIFGPTGIGILYGKERYLELMPPYQSGGDMIRSVTFEKTIFNDLPFKFEAGTPNIAGVIGMHAALKYISSLPWENIIDYEAELLRYATEQLQSMDGVRILGTARKKSGVLSFVMDGVHPHDIGTILDEEGIAIRTGHHCAQPVMERFGVPATARASFAFYNTTEELDALIRGLRKVKEIFHV
ncbi:MAG TPA: cysteine desulfurase [Bacteroidota bacterium]|nr:cysteine desulfurase [Bacteroidota bacterium]